jgi:hypothetical protein
VTLVHVAGAVACTVDVSVGGRRLLGGRLSGWDRAILPPLSDVTGFRCLPGPRRRQPNVVNASGTAGVGSTPIHAVDVGVDVQSGGPPGPPTGGAAHPAVVFSIVAAVLELGGEVGGCS